MLTSPLSSRRGMIGGMEVFLLTVGAAYAAFFAWLIVRIVNRKERWAKRMLAMVVALPVLYVASFGPACWWDSRSSFGPAVVGYGSMPHAAHWPLPSLYRPLLAIACTNAPDTAANAALAWYANLGADRHAIIGWFYHPGASERSPELLWDVPMILPVKSAATTPDAKSESN